MVEKTEEQQAFEEAVERLYAVFDKYPLRADTEPCLHCVDPEDEQKLHDKPLRELDRQELEDYGRDALHTWGNVGDFKHFLPRLFELVEEAYLLGWVDAEVLFAKLRIAQWQDWPEDEQVAVRDYLMSLWRHCLTGGIEDVEIGDMLCGIGRAVDDLTPYLSAWRRSGREGQRLLAAFVPWQAELISQSGKLSNPFWEDRTAQMNQVISWLRDPDTKQSLEEAYAIEPLEEFASAINSLDRLAEFDLPAEPK